MAQVAITTDDKSVRGARRVTGHKFFLLFLFLLAYLALYPYMGVTGARYYMFRLVSAAVMPGKCAAPPAPAMITLKPAAFALLAKA